MADEILLTLDEILLTGNYGVGNCGGYALGVRAAGRVHGEKQAVVGGGFFIPV